MIHSVFLTFFLSILAGRGHDVGGDLLLGFDLCLAGEHFSFLLSVFIEVPDDALPYSVCSTEYVTVSGQSLFRHLPAPFL